MFRDHKEARGIQYYSLFITFIQCVHAVMHICHNIISNHESFVTHLNPIFLLTTTNTNPINNSTMTSKSIEIIKVTCKDPTEPSALSEGVTELFQLYFKELYELGCDLGFQGFQSEWTDLPGKYDFDRMGGLFVAVEVESNGSGSRSMISSISSSKQVVGCIAIRPLIEIEGIEGSCESICGEVKRMYIRKSHRRNGVGNMLANAIIAHAWDLGYTEIKLDSLERLIGAVKLYEQLGFQRIPPYCECPEQDHVCLNLSKQP